MKIKINNYTFTPANRTIVFNDYSSIKLDDILLITDVSTGTIIYNFASANLTGSVSGNTLTLNYNTTGLSPSNLSIYYDEPESKPSTDESIVLLRRMVKLLEPIATQDANQRQRINIDTLAGGLTLSTVTTIGQVNNANAIGNVDGRFHFMELARVSYSTGIRSKIV